jgi:glutathione-independent formaldehyde dehydrogenase
VPGDAVQPQLMMAILHDKVQIAKNVNATVIPLD